MRSSFLAAGIACLALTPALAAEHLDIKPGQWQMTTTMHMDGLSIPPEALARMPAQAQAQVQAMMQAMTQPHVTKSCMTPARVQRGFTLDHTVGGKCHQTMANVTATSMEVSGACAFKDGDSTMHGVFSAPDPGTLNGTVEVNRAAAKGPRHMTMQFEGKWVAAACDGTEEDNGAEDGK